MNLKKSLFAALAVAALAATSLTASAQKTDPTVGGAAMYPTKTIVENAAQPHPHHPRRRRQGRRPRRHPQLARPLHRLRPHHDAFAKLPAGTVDNLVKPENKDTLVKILTYHVVPGRISSKELKKDIKKGGGTATLKTVQGEPLTFTMSGGNIVITDAKGGTANITTADVFQSNGVIHVIDTVLMPN